MRILDRISYKYIRPKNNSTSNTKENANNSFIYETIPINTNQSKEAPPNGLIIYKVMLGHIFLKNPTFKTHFLFSRSGVLSGFLSSGFSQKTRFY